jgi:hypothetical protein
MSSPQNHPKQNLTSVVTAALSDEAKAKGGPLPLTNMIQTATELPRRGTATLPDNISLSGLPFKKQYAYTGDVEFWPGTNIPAGIWVDVKAEHKSHYQNVDRHFLPASACMAITLKKVAQ